MATNLPEWLRRRMKAIKRISNILVAEEKELSNRGINLNDLFDEARKTNEKILAGLETEINIAEKGG
jgi:hypothetical protein